MTLGVMTLVLRDAQDVRRGRLDRAAVVDEPVELHDLRLEVQVDGVVIRADDRLDFQRHAGVALLEARRRRRRHREWLPPLACRPVALMTVMPPPWLPKFCGICGGWNCVG